jgi:hypothetical protein
MAKKIEKGGNKNRQRKKKGARGHVFVTPKF